MKKSGIQMDAAIGGRENYPSKLKGKAIHLLKQA
jgi:hypothetical protein